MSNSVPAAKRTPDEIYAAILTELITHGSLRISHVMLHANLNSSQAKNYLTELITRGHIEVKNGKYSVTDKGREWLLKRRETLALQI